MHINNNVDQIYPKAILAKWKSTRQDSMPYSKIKIHLKELNFLDSSLLISKIEESKKGE